MRSFGASSPQVNLMLGSVLTGTDGQCSTPSPRPDDGNLQAQAGVSADLLNLRRCSRRAGRLIGGIGLLLLVHGLKVNFGQVNWREPCA